MKLKNYHWYIIIALGLVGLYFLLQNCKCSQNKGTVNATTKEFINPNSAVIDAEFDKKKGENL